MVLDQCLTTIHSSDIVGVALVNHIHIFLSWFTHYSRSIQITLPNSTISTGGISEEKPWVNSRSNQLRSPTFTNQSYHSPTQFTSPTKLSPAYGASPRPPQPIIHQFKGITYKEISKFYHDYGIVPYLLKDPQLYKYV